MKITLRFLSQRVVMLWAVLALLSSGRAQAQLANDDCSGAVSLMTSAVCTVPVNGTVATATQSLAPTIACGFGLTTATDVWYSFTATASSHLVTLAPRFTAVLDVRSGTCATSTTSVFCTTIANNNTAAVPVSGLTSGQTYFIRVYPATNTPPSGISSTFALCIGQGVSTPNNDDCAGAISVPVNSSVCTNTVSADNTTATASVGVPAPICASYQGGDLWFTVAVPASGNVTVQTVVASTGTDIGDTGMSIYSGTCGNLVALGCDDDAAGNLKSLLSFTGRTAGEVLYVRVWGYGGRTGTIAVCATTPAPLLNDDCAGAVALPVTTACTAPVAGTVAGATQSLPVTTGCGFVATAADVWYSFTAGGATQTLNFTGGFQAVIDVRSGTCASSSSIFCGTTFTGQPLTLTGLTSGQPYFLRLYPNNTVTPTNAQFTLCLNPGPTPATNDNCATATPLPVTATCAAPVAGTLLGASQSLPPTANCSGTLTVANDVWYSFVASGATQILTFVGGFGAVVDVRSGTCASSTSVFCGTAFTNQPITLSGLTSGQPYFLRLYLNGTFMPTNSTFTLCLNPGPTPAANDDCANATPLPVTATCAAPVSGTLLGASQSLPATANCGAISNANDVWYSFTANGATQLLSFTGLFTAIVDVRSGTCASSASVFCTTVFNGQQLALTGLTSGQPYFLRLYLSGTFTPANPTFTLCLNPGPTPPANDNCAGAIGLPVATSCLAPVTGTVAAASQSLPVTTGCGFATTAADVWYSFTANGTSQTLSFAGNFQAVVEVRSGTCATSTSVFCSTVFTGQQVILTGLTNNQAYFLRLYSNSTIPPLPANSAFSLCLTAGPPPLNNDECATAVPVSVVANCTTSLNGTVSGASQSLPPTAACGAGVTTAADVWYSFVAGASAQLITLNPRFPAVLDVRSGTCASSASVFCTTVFANNTVGTAVGGLTAGQTYFIRIYANGTTQPIPASATFTLCVSPAPTPPANDECTSAVPISVAATCATPVSGTVEAATQSLPTTASCSFAATAADVWYSFVAGGVSQLITLNPRFPTVLEVRSGTCASSASVFCTTVFANNTVGAAVGGLTAGQTYFVRVYANNTVQPVGINATFTLCVTAAPTPPINDDCAGAINVPVQFGTTCASQTTTDNTAATGSNVPNPGCANYQGGDVWFSVTVPASGAVTVQTVVPTVGLDVGDTGLSVYSGTCASLTLLGCNDDSGGSFKSLLSFTGRTPGEVLYVRVWGYGGVRGTLAVCATSPTNCATPTQLTSTGITATSAQLSWQPGGTPATGTTYTVEYGPQGFALGSGTVINVLPTASVALVLQPGTAYCYYVRQNCPGGNGTSAYAGPSCFTTPCAVPVSLAATATSTGAQVSWQSTGTPPTGTTYTVEYGLQGFTPGTGNTISGIPGTSFTLMGLLPNTAYCFYVRQDCPGSTGSGAFAGPACFTTLAIGNVPVNDDPCAAITLPLTAAGSPAQPIAGTNVGATTSTQPGIGAPTCSPATSPRDVWFVMTPAAGVTAVALTLTGAPAGMVRVFTAPNCATGTFALVACRSSGANNTGVGLVTLTGLTPGRLYYLAVSGYGAADTPGTFSIGGAVVTGTRTQANTNALLVYPNPSNTGQLTFKLGQAAARPATVALLNALGQQVQTATLAAGTTEHTLNTHGLATGLYTLCIVVDGDVLTRKVVLE